MAGTDSELVEGEFGAGWGEADYRALEAFLEFCLLNDMESHWRFLKKRMTCSVLGFHSVIRYALEHKLKGCKGRSRETS